jgi:ABC-type proline/glycine betaine transport system ATPase subunit
VIFNEGRIQQIGAPAELRENPTNDFVRAFLEV